MTTFTGDLKDNLLQQGIQDWDDDFVVYEPDGG